MKKLILMLTLIALCGLASAAQNQIKMTAKVQMTAPGQGQVVIDATMEPGWHLYGLQLPDGGPNPTTISFEGSKGVTFDGPLTPAVPAEEHYDATFELNLAWWENTAQFTQAFKVDNPAEAEIKVTARYMGCNDETCIPPQTAEFTLPVPEYVATAATCSCNCNCTPAGGAK